MVKDKLHFYLHDDLCVVRRPAKDMIDVCTMRFETDDIIFRNWDDGLKFTVPVKYLKEIVGKYDELKKDWGKNDEECPF
jgi:hypothetical protein